MTIPKNMEDAASEVDRTMEWIKQSPAMAAEMMAAIRYKCRPNSIETLTPEERAYIFDAFGKILRAKDLDPRVALHLAAKGGRPATLHSDRNHEIYNRVIQLVEQGYSRPKAFDKISTEPIASKQDGTARLTNSAISKIFYDLKKAYGL